MNKNHLFLIWVLAHGLLGCSAQFNAMDIGVSPDFSKTHIQKLSASDQTWVPATDCRQNIVQVLCEVDPSEKLQNPLGAKCLGGEEQYKNNFEALYDSLDPITQKAFCSVRKILVHQVLSSTAYASTLWTQKDGVDVPISGALIGVRKSIVLNPPDFNTWISWKEQLNFVLPGEFQAPLKYPRYEAGPTVTLLGYVMTHEVGHILDYSNQLNKVTLGRPECMNEKIESEEDYINKCQPKIEPGSWSDIDWATPMAVRPERDFPLRDQLCFYNCEKRLDAETQGPILYGGLSKSSFASTYAATNLMDDFAEAWATRWVVEHQKSDVLLYGGPKVTISAKEFYNSERFKTKREFIEKFVQGPIKYP